MTTCNGCGGVVGRDCFNPQECEEITRSMAANRQHEQGAEREELLAVTVERDRYKAALEEIEKFQLELTAGLFVFSPEHTAACTTHNIAYKALKGEA